MHCQSKLPSFINLGHVLLPKKKKKVPEELGCKDQQSGISVAVLENQAHNVYWSRQASRSHVEASARSGVYIFCLEVQRREVQAPRMLLTAERVPMYCVCMCTLALLVNLEKGLIPADGGCSLIYSLGPGMEGLDPLLIKNKC